MRRAWNTNCVAAWRGVAEIRCYARDRWALVCTCSASGRVPAPCGNVFDGYLGRADERSVRFAAVAHLERAAPRVVTPAVLCASPHRSLSSRAAVTCSRARVPPGRRGAAASSSRRLDAWRCRRLAWSACPWVRAAPRRGGGDRDDEEREYGGGDDDGDASGPGYASSAPVCGGGGRVVVAFAR